MDVANDLSEVVNSLGHMILDQTRKLGVRQVQICVDPQSGQADVTVTIHPGLPDEAQAEIVRRLVYVRSFYLDELAISYSLEASDEVIVVSGYQAPGNQYAFA